MEKLSGNMLRFKNMVNKSKNRNIRFVSVRNIRQCKYCGRIIGVGNTCLTTNNKSEGRRWVCLGCVDAILRYKESKAQIDCVAFGDEGDYMASYDFMVEASAELYSRGIL